MPGLDEIFLKAFVLLRLNGPGITIGFETLVRDETIRWRVFVREGSIVRFSGSEADETPELALDTFMKELRRARPAHP